MQPTSDDDNGQDKGSTTDLSSAAKPQSPKDKPNSPAISPLKPQVQTNQEDTEPEEVENPEISKPKEMISIPEAVVLETVEEIVKSSANVQTTNELVDSTLETLVQEEILQEGDGTPIDLNLDFYLQGQDVSMFQKDKEDVESVSPKEKETTDLGSTELNSPIEIAKDADAKLITIPNPNMEPEPLLSTEVTETQEQP